MFHQNIQHLPSRINSLEAILTEIKPHIITLTEHDMKEEEINRLNINSYLVKSCFSRKTKNKGGVMILTKEGFELREVSVPESLSGVLLEDMQFEFCVCTFVVSRHKYIIVGIYRSPNSNVNIFLDRLGILIDYLKNKCDKLIIAGDFNIDVLQNDNKHKLFKELLKSHNMRYLVDFPTRVTENTKTAIDNFLVMNIELSNIKTEGIITFLSDHDGQLLEVKCRNSIKEVKLPLKQEIRKFSTENIVLFDNFLSKETWSDVYFATVEEKYDTFHKLLLFYFNQAFPKTLITKKNRKKNWITEDLKVKRINIIKLAKEYRNNKTKRNKRKLEQEKKDYKIKLNEAKTNFFKNKIDNSKNIQKTVWSIINSEVSDKQSKSISNIILKEGTKILSDPYLVSNTFNKHFINVVPDIDSDDSGTVKENVASDIRNELFVKPEFRLKSVSRAEVEKIIESLKNKHSSGFDEIPIVVLKAVKGRLSQVLCHLINSSFVSGIFPKQLKMAKIIPLYKKNDKMNALNYRPVSLLPSISKIFEKAVYLQVAEFLEIHNLLDDSQHGFRQGRSVVSAAVSFIETVINSVDGGKFTTGIFMDLSKAFDSVKHSKLIEKLKILGVGQNALNWFESYLVDRSQYVEISHLTKSNKITKISSTCMPIRFGVPQGSILGPLLFLCYLRGIDSSLVYKLNSKLCLYADDSNLVISTNSAEEMEVCAFVELENIGNYLQNHNLVLNSQKTKFVTFKTAQNRISKEPIINYQSNNIKNETYLNFLGLTIDQNLNWNEHVHKILIRMNSGIYALSKMSFYCNLETLKSIYFAHVHSHMLFCIALYGSTKKVNLDNILKQQKRAIRIMLKLQRDDSAKEHFKNLKILTVYSQYIYDCILIARKHELDKNYETPTHPYNTRKRDGTIQPHRLKFFEKKPTYAGQRFYRYIPEIIKKENNFIKFKKILKDHLINLAIYSIEEFSTSLT